MKKTYLIFLSSALLSAAPHLSKAQQSAQGAPVETKEANTPGYKPAFKGQTRIGGVVTKTPYEGKVLTNALHNPWGIAALPDGRFLINEKGGTMRIVTAAGKIGDPINNVPKVNPDGQGGLLGVTLDPAFKTNRMIYWAFSDKLAEGNCTALAKGKLSADEKSLENVTVLYRALPAHNSSLHYGGRVLIGKDGFLYLTTGERSDLATRPLAQDLNAGLGKVIRLTKDGKPAPGNPFIGKANAKPEVYSYGHRNVQGIAQNPFTGDIYESEFGPRGGDEINRIVAGKNYGWPTITYGIEYSGKKIGDSIQQKAGLEQPVYYWDPVISPSGITFYDGKLIPEWKGNLFVSSLSGMHIDRLVIVNNKVTGEERLLSQENQRFRDIKEGVDGALYAITDQGRLYRIGKK